MRSSITTTRRASSTPPSPARLRHHDCTLAPGEKLLTAAAGDTTRWIVQSVDSGSGIGANAACWSNRARPGCKRTCHHHRSAHLLAGSEQHRFIDVSHDDRLELSLRRCGDDSQSGCAAAGANAGNNRLRNGSVQGELQLPHSAQKHATTPPWCPLRAFDDGRKTYIQFPPKVP
jgi:hypothetical protein